MAGKADFANKSDLGKLILTKLGKMNKSQFWLANQCGVTAGQINHVISGHRAPSYKLLCDISKQLYIEGNDLLK